MWLNRFFETMFFSPQWYHYSVIIMFLPLALLYGIVMWFRRLLTKKIAFSIPILSVGNLIVGGSGKTPFCIALALKYEDVCIVSRGYGRQSKGLVEVSFQGKILTTVEQSGDEAMLMARALPLASVIVSEDRHKAIDLAKKKGAKLIVLDDGFNRVEIKKFEILLEPEYIVNRLPFPAGALREFYFSKKYANLVLRENREFKRVVTIENSTPKMLLVTAISNPKRLESFLPKGVIEKIYYEDHAYFDEKILKEKMKESKATSLLVTEKDLVKMKNFTLTLSVMRLSLEIDDNVFQQISFKNLE